MPAPVQRLPRLSRLPRFLGLDMSLAATGVCGIAHSGLLDQHWLTNHGTTRIGTLEPPSLTGPARLDWIFKELVSILEAEKPALVAIEGYAHGASFQAHALGEVGGMARLLLYKMGIPYVEVQPTSLKQFLTGKGKATKPQIKKAIKAKWGTDIKDHNAADAYGLALIAALSACPDWQRMNAGEVALVQALRYCSPDGKPPAPLLSRPI